jgi:hypothetical protein
MHASAQRIIVEEHEPIVVGEGYAVFSGRTQFKDVSTHSSAQRAFPAIEKHSLRLIRRSNESQVARIIPSEHAPEMRFGGGGGEMAVFLTVDITGRHDRRW